MRPVLMDTTWPPMCAEVYNKLQRVSQIPKAATHSCMAKCKDLSSKYVVVNARSLLSTSTYVLVKSLKKIYAVIASMNLG